MFHETQLKFVGEDGYMGLKCGHIYNVQIFMRNGRLCVELPSNRIFGNRMCTYDSLTELTRQWVDVYNPKPLTLAELFQMDGDVVQDSSGKRYIINIDYLNPHTHRHLPSGIDMCGNPWSLEMLAHRCVFPYKPVGRD